jgi:hypothetical protein
MIYYVRILVKIHVGKINEMKSLIDDSRMKLILRVNLIICYVCQTLWFNINPTLLSFLLSLQTTLKKTLIWVLSWPYVC